MSFLDVLHLHLLHGGSGGNGHTLARGMAVTSLVVHTIGTKFNYSQYENRPYWVNNVSIQWHVLFIKIKI